jgi:hypothetical protein
MAKMLKRCFDILEETQTKYDKTAVAGIVKTLFPDNRRLLTFLQMESQLGEVGAGSLSKAASATPEALIEAMQGKKYKEVQQWILNNADRLSDDFYERLFKMLEPKIADQAVPQLVLILADGQKFDHIVPSKYIHFLAIATEVMMQVQFK